jgi:hypothetical protein
VVVIVPWQPAKILASNQDTLVDLRRDLEVDKLHNLHRYRAAVDRAQFVIVLIDLCMQQQRQVDYVLEEEEEADGAWTLMAVGRMTVCVVA